MGTFIAIVLSAVLTNNFITVKTYGICPFLGVSKKTSSAVGMGIAVTLVMVLATLVTYPIYTYAMIPLHIEFLEIIYLPLITTNCAVLGVTELVLGDMSSVIGAASMNVGWAVLYALFSGLGFTLVMVIMSGMREKLNCYKLPKAVSGFPVAMVTASFICMAFMVFTYIVI